MPYKRISDLETRQPKASDMLLMFDATSEQAVHITIEQLIGIQQEKMSKPCEYCGSYGVYDSRGNCAACGAPRGTHA